MTENRLEFLKNFNLELVVLSRREIQFFSVAEFQSPRDVLFALIIQVHKPAFCLNKDLSSNPPFQSSISSDSLQGFIRQLINCVRAVCRPGRIVRVSNDHCRLFKLVESLPPDGFPRVLRILLFVMLLDEDEDVMNPDNP